MCKGEKMSLNDVGVTLIEPIDLGVEATMGSGLGLVVAGKVGASVTTGFGCKGLLFK